MLTRASLPRKRIATRVEHTSNVCRVTAQLLCKECRGREMLHGSIRIGMSHAFLPDSDDPLCSYLHFEVQQAVHAHVELSPALLAATGTVHCCCCRYNIILRSFLLRCTTSFDSTPAYRDHVSKPLPTAHSLTQTSFHHARLGSFCKSRRRTRPHRGACYPAWLPALRFRCLRRVSIERNST